jgi:protein-tyrosine-phosphatase
MAAGIASKRLSGRVEAASAGIAAAGGPAAEDAVRVMKIVYQVDLSGHVARNITDFDLRAFDDIVAMDLAIYTYLKGLRILPEEKLSGWDIEDPLGRGYDAFKDTAVKIERRLEQMIARLGLDV